MATCDLCGKRCSALKMQQLRDSYATAEIKDLCEGCTDWAGKLKDRLVLEVPVKMKDLLKARKNDLQRPIGLETIRSRFGL